MTSQYESEMGASHQDFFRLLPIALKNLDYEVTKDNQINISYAKGKIEILPGKEQKRKIASLELPFMFVIFNFINISAAKKSTFLANFMRTYQRGGG